MRRRFLRNSSIMKKSKIINIFIIIVSGGFLIIGLYASLALGAFGCDDPDSAFPWCWIKASAMFSWPFILFGLLPLWIAIKDLRTKDTKRE